VKSSSTRESGRRQVSPRSHDGERHNPILRRLIEVTLYKVKLFDNRHCAIFGAAPL